MIRRANILKNTKEPVIYKKITFPVAEYELFFDIEADPTREFVYIHGIYERSSQGEKYLDFTARDITPEAEKEAWIMFWDYIRSLPSDNYAVYYYSKYERTAYRALQKKYPDVVTSEEVENFFNPEKAIDLYTDVVLKHTDWPLGSYSIKELAVHLGFKWEDTTPSGALSIEWFNRFIESKDEKVMERILVYNKDDCVATMMLKDGLQKLFDGS